MNIGIIGLGLIGGSLGIDLRNQGPAERSQRHRVFGVSRSLKTRQTAISLRAVHDARVIDEARTDLEWLVEEKEVELIFICTPLDQTVSTLERLAPHLERKKQQKGQTTIVTDVGSAKASIVYRCIELWPNFVGGHPMAGTADRGIKAAQPGLFVKKPYVLTPTANTPAKSVEVLESIVYSLGANLEKCSPEEHDRAVAWISHLPVMVSTSLIRSCMGETDLKIRELSRNLSSSGFASTSRVGGGNPELGVLMAKYNQEALLRSLQQYRQNLDNLIHQIETEDWSNLGKTLESSQHARGLFVKE